MGKTTVIVTSGRNFRSDIVRALRTGAKTTSELYEKVENQELIERLSYSAPDRDQLEWTHRLRRDQQALREAGVIKKTGNGWALANGVVVV